MKAIVVLGGQIGEKDFYAGLISEHDLVIGADGGTEIIRDLGLVPDMAVGDFDSISAGTLRWLEERGVSCRRFPPDKDLTDGELAVEAALGAGASSLTLTAAWGGRIDHSLGNLFLLRLAWVNGVPCRLVEAGVEVVLLGAGDVQIDGFAGDTVSLIPLETCVGLTLEGFRYPADGITIHPGSTRCLSNLLINGRGKIKMDAGQVLIIHSRPTEGL